ncbi:3'(2'),5'-bisphosphate nucleotidase CysQ [Methylobacterium sp. WCS2018Hpa-22]|uniref:3'(2'),5'-bisphosphate nucleotidase CysQ n=1 Tax=Methylobacterium sp. WCS2018Hpa-22 TaxID=3073633 RepID=UPI00288A0642|nr:3'(2'),5'-bisphosphate nucleotidase CysQ [Methylobacterium sp. WCS2018Hpa-22]
MGSNEVTEVGRAGDDLARDLARIAVTAGSPVAVIFAAGCAPTWKGDGSPVTDADLAAEGVIYDRLSDGFPGMPIVSEERIAAGDAPMIGPRFALVDPLDGTREFIAGRNEFTVNVAIVEQGRPVAGAIYAPMLQRLWYGGAAAYTCPVAPGADLPEVDAMRRINVRSASPGHLVALISRSHIDPRTEAYLQGLTVAERRPMGSSLKFCVIAEGQADLYPRFGVTCEWDTAAGCAILTAAGGSIVDPEGRPLRYGDAHGGFRHAGFVALGDLRFKTVAEGDLR